MEDRFKPGQPWNLKLQLLKQQREAERNAENSKKLKQRQKAAATLGTQAFCILPFITKLGHLRVRTYFIIQQIRKAVLSTSTLQQVLKLQCFKTKPLSMNTKSTYYHKISWLNKKNLELQRIK